ncbi:hypothetical protein Ddye_023297 [Dipteronia dyeriana]|uniref:BED-type domain-containing protein n=1 Tax=Dipteronia dyeriana TaxID=168575 RepID=A0AAD9WS02_9ROSI|nr:hypothetical protein Ddye_023297 [Dipteronia dyeriana]
MTSFEGSQVNVSTGSGNNEVEDVEPSNASDGFKQNRGTSFFWNCMTKVDVKGIRMANCDFCEKLLNATQGTSSLRKHVLKCFDDHQEATNSTNTSFDQNVGKSKVAKAIIMHELPLRFVEYTGFWEMIEYCQPRFESMSRNTLKSEIFKLYNMERDKTLKLLDSIDSKIAVTTDMWTSSTKRGYVVVTMHFIDKSWVLHSRIMRFIHVLSPHDATSLGEQLVTYFYDWNVDRKLSAITVDNCSTNDCMIV